MLGLFLLESWTCQHWSLWGLSYSLDPLLDVRRTAAFMLLWFLVSPVFVQVKASNEIQCIFRAIPQTKGTTLWVLEKWGARFGELTVLATSADESRKTFKTLSSHSVVGWIHQLIKKNERSFIWMCECEMNSELTHINDLHLLTAFKLNFLNQTLIKQSLVWRYLKGIVSFPDGAGCRSDTCRDRNQAISYGSTLIRMHLPAFSETLINTWMMCKWVQVTLVEGVGVSRTSAPVHTETHRAEVMSPICTFREGSAVELLQ